MIRPWNSHCSSSFSSSARSRSWPGATRGSTRQTGAVTTRDDLPGTGDRCVRGRRAWLDRDPPRSTCRRPALARLEGLAGRSLGNEPILVVEADGELVAAAPAAGGEVVSDPFRVTLDVVELLQLRTSQLRAAA